MRSVTGGDAAALHLLKTFLEALASRGEERVDSQGKAPLGGGKDAQPPAPAPPTKTHPGSPPPFVRPAPVAAEAVAAQMLATLMAERDIASGALAEISGDSDGRKDSGASDARPEEPALAQPKPGTANGAIPWPNEALAAYGARPREPVGLQPGVRPPHTGPGGRSDPEGAKLSTLKLFRNALVCACVIALFFVLLNRDALFG